MMATSRAPKQWCLSKCETVNTFENWRQNLKYSLSLDPNFAPFLVDGAKWEKQTKTSPLRGLTADGEDGKHYVLTLLPNEELPKIPESVKNAVREQ